MMATAHQLTGLAVKYSQFQSSCDGIEKECVNLLWREIVQAMHTSIKK
jgi:hypothetical protein